MTTCQHDPLFTHDGRCTKCFPRKRVIIVQHADGRVEIDDAPLLHQCGWCGEWYTGSRVDHGCPAEPVSAMEQDYIDSFDAPRPGYIVNPAAQMWGWMGDDTITTGEIAELEARCDETEGNREER